MMGGFAHAGGERAELGAAMRDQKNTVNFSFAKNGVPGV
jgi:hypothetical protein